jgi:hypothetical protein
VEFSAVKLMDHGVSGFLAPELHQGHAARAAISLGEHFQVHDLAVWLQELTKFSVSCCIWKIIEKNAAGEREE